MSRLLNPIVRCYFRLLIACWAGPMEAEDMVQEAYLRYENAQDVQSPKAYLTTIITRLCLDDLKSAKSQRENYVGTWLPEPVLTSPSPDAILSQHESISMAFLVLLEELSPLERAIFLLRAVFDYSNTVRPNPQLAKRSLNWMSQDPLTGSSINLFTEEKNCSHITVRLADRINPGTGSNRRGHPRPE